MKKKSRHSDSTARLKFFLFSLIVPLIAIPASVARANSDLDRKYALETVGYLRAWDNMDGLFSEYIAAAYKEFFLRQSRFVLQDLSKADALLGKSKIAYNKLIMDNDVLGQLARATKSQTIIRTKVMKEGFRYRFTIEWLHSPHMDLLSSESVTLEEPPGATFGLTEIRAALEKALDQMIKKLPFSGHVTGRDGNSVTVNVGATGNLKKGDTLVIATLEEVKRHPLLSQVVDWRFAQTGKAEVDTVDDGIAFCRVIDEEPGRQISRYQKIINVIPRPELPEQDDKAAAAERAKRNRPPSLGWMGLAPWIGSFSRQDSSLNSTSGKTGGGLFLGAKAQGQLWLTREWFAELALGYGYAGYSQQDIQTGANTAAQGVSATVMNYRFDAGYTYLASGDLLGPKGWVKLGYRGTSYSLPASDTEFTGNSAFKGLFLGVGADLPLRGRFGATLSLDFGVFSSAEETGYVPAALTGATDVGFSLGAYYLWSQKTTIKAGVDVLSNGADRIGGSSLTHRIISFGPELLFYF